MRLGHAIGLTAGVLGVAAAVLAFAPAIEAQQGAKTGAKTNPGLVSGPVSGTGGKQEQTVTVTVDDQGRVTQNVMPRVTTNPGLVSAVAGGPRLGVSIRDLETADVTKLKLGGLAGVFVEDVSKDSAAAKAGIKNGDVIVQFDGENVRSTRQFTRLVTESAAGRAVKVGVMRDGKRVDVEATPANAESEFFNIQINGDEIRQNVERGMAQAQRGLAQAERNRALAERDRAQVERNIERATPLLRQFRMERGPGMPGPLGQGPNVYMFDGQPGSAVLGRGRLGVTVQELTPELATYFGVKDGVLVSTVNADSPAAKAGIKPGDVITAVNDKPVTDADSLVSQLREKEGDVTIGVSRDKKAMSLKATMEKPTPVRARTIVRGIPI
jgi:serine protease Do